MTWPDRPRNYPGAPRRALRHAVWIALLHAQELGFAHVEAQLTRILIDVDQRRVAFEDAERTSGGAPSSPDGPSCRRPTRHGDVMERDRLVDFGEFERRIHGAPPDRVLPHNLEAERSILRAVCSTAAKPIPSRRRSSTATTSSATHTGASSPR